MKAFVLKQHEKMAPAVRAIRDEEMKSITGGVKCKGGKETTVTSNSNGSGGDDGCDAQ